MAANINLTQDERENVVNLVNEYYQTHFPGLNVNFTHSDLEFGEPVDLHLPEAYYKKSLTEINNDLKPNTEISVKIIKEGFVGPKFAKIQYHRQNLRQVLPKFVPTFEAFFTTDDILKLGLKRENNPQNKPIILAKLKEKYPVLAGSIQDIFWRNNRYEITFLPDSLLYAEGCNFGIVDIKPSDGGEYIEDGLPSINKNPRDVKKRGWQFLAMIPLTAKKDGQRVKIQDYRQQKHQEGLGLTSPDPQYGPSGYPQVPGTLVKLQFTKFREDGKTPEFTKESPYYLYDDGTTSDPDWRSFYITSKKGGDNFETADDVVFNHPTVATENNEFDFGDDMVNYVRYRYIFCCGSDGKWYDEVLKDAESQSDDRTAVENILAGRAQNQREDGSFTYGNRPMSQQEEREERMREARPPMEGPSEEDLEGLGG